MWESGPWLCDGLIDACANNTRARVQCYAAARSGAPGARYACYVAARSGRLSRPRRRQDGIAATAVVFVLISSASQLAPHSATPAASPRTRALGEISVQLQSSTNRVQSLTT